MIKVYTFVLEKNLNFRSRPRGGLRWAGIFKELEEGLKTANQNVHLIGGANIAAQLDAKMAIKEASELAAKL